MQKVYQFYANHSKVNFSNFPIMVKKKKSHLQGQFCMKKNSEHLNYISERARNINLKQK